MTNLTLTEVQRAAVVLLSLGEAQAAEVLKHMGAKEVQKLGVAMTSVGGVSRQDVERVIDDFVNTLEQPNIGSGRIVIEIPGIGSDDNGQIRFGCAPLQSNRQLCAQNQLVGQGPRQDARQSGDDCRCQRTMRYFIHHEPVQQFHLGIVEESEFDEILELFDGHGSHGKRGNPFDDFFRSHGRRNSRQNGSQPGRRDAFVHGFARLPRGFRIAAGDITHPLLQTGRGHSSSLP